MINKKILTDVDTLRSRARTNIRRGAVTPGYKADREALIKILNEALATEIVCVLRYKRHQFMAKGIHAKVASLEFAQHAVEEQAHADLIAGRIIELGGEPDYSPASLTLRSHSQYVEGGNLEEMIEENLVAERIAIESYGEIIAYLGEKDPTTRRLLESILAKEEEHAEDLSSILQELPPSTLNGGSPSH